jgi:hypothetical protein
MRAGVEGGESDRDQMLAERAVVGVRTGARAVQVVGPLECHVVDLAALHPGGHATTEHAQAAHPIDIVLAPVENERPGKGQQAGNGQA